jgi:hypothetical protein
LNGALVVGFLQSAFLNSSGFQSLVLTINESTSQMSYPTVSDTFNSLSSAQSFFNDTVLTLNNIIPADPSLQVDFDLDLTSNGGGDDFAGQLLFGDPVPEPSTWALMGGSVAFLLFAAYRKKWKRDQGARDYSKFPAASSALTFSGTSMPHSS